MDKIFCSELYIFVHQKFSYLSIFCPLSNQSTSPRYYYGQIIAKTVSFLGQIYFKKKLLYIIERIEQIKLKQKLKLKN